MMGLSDFSEFLSILDYVIILLMLVISMGIGFYHGLKNRKVLKDEEEYLMAGKSMSVVPVSLSILASSVSGLCLIGFATEMYLYGSAYLYGILNVMLAIAFFNKFLLPVFHALEITSIYNYLEKRFNRKVRIFGSCSFVILATLYMPILLYMPCLSFNQVTGIDIKVTAAVLTMIVIFYTCIGGFRATVWTDVFQAVVMCTSVVVVIVKGYVDQADKTGLSAIFQKSYQTNRYEFPTFDLDPTIRISLWSIGIGGPCYTVFFVCNQIVLQRCLALPTLTEAKKASWIFGILFCFIFIIGLFGGTLLVAMFSSCDPKSSGIIKEYDQLIPLLVLLTSKSLPGLKGIFIGGLFCASLSSISTYLNSLAAVILEDFCKTFYKGNLSKRIRSFIMRGVVVGFGLIAIPLTVIAEKTDTILQFSYTIESVISSPVLGIFIMGIFFPSIDGKCALAGGISSLFFVGWITLSANRAIASKDLTFETKHLDHSDCPNIFNTTLSSATDNEVEKSDVMFLFRISYFYYIPLGLSTTIFVAFLVRFILGGNKTAKVDSTLIYQSSHRQTHRIKIPSGIERDEEEAGKLMNYQKDS